MSEETTVYLPTDIWGSKSSKLRSSVRSSTGWSWIRGLDQLDQESGSRHPVLTQSGKVRAGRD